MSREERLKPKIINGMRRRRIAAGSGHSIQEVNMVLQQWGQMNKMMGKVRQLQQSGSSKKAMRGMSGMMRNMGIDPSMLGGMGGGKKRR